MEYLAKFDDAGRRTATVCEGVHYATDEEKQVYLDGGYVPISEEDYNYYVGNHGQGDNGTGYIRDPQTGKPVSAPPAPKVKPREIPSEPDVDETAVALAEAVASQEAEIAALKAEVEALKGGDKK